MNSIELEVEMKRHGDTGAILADYLGMTPQTFCAKKNANGAEFTQGEILRMKTRYGLSGARLDEIFFAHTVS